MENLKLMAAVGVVLLLTSVACGGDTGEQVVTGRVVDAIARDLVEIESLTVRDADSQIWEFTTTGPVGISVGHLRQHQALGQKIQVTFRKIGGQLIASDVRDAVVVDEVVPEGTP
ncbi:MAG: hypothetical protein H8E48_04325 [Chloroflexi bacterium]|nr:hypothetical protein [Chloroflexota bacterium]